MSTTENPTTEDTSGNGFGFRPLPASWADHGRHDEIADGETRVYAAAVAYTPANKLTNATATPVEGSRRFIEDGKLAVRYINPHTGLECGDTLRAIRTQDGEEVYPLSFYTDGPEGFRASFGTTPSHDGVRDRIDPDLEARSATLNFAQRARELYDIEDGDA